MDINFNFSLGAVHILYCCAILNCVKSNSFIVTLFDFTPNNSGGRYKFLGILPKTYFLSFNYKHNRD